MEKNMKISIGAPTYNDSSRIQGLFTTLITYTQTDNYNLVMLDDGTKNKDKVNELKELGEELSIPLILNDSNRGIPYSWNRLTEFYEDTDYMILFNDDIQISSSSWLENIIYFLENNEHVGSAGMSLVHIDPNTGKRNMNLDLPNEDVQPGKVGCAVGCAFAFKKFIWKDIKQEDGSTGFWEALVSFYEELDFGFELAKRGYASYMIPSPPCEHWGSRTFANNAELSVRPFIDYLPRDEYLSILEAGQDKLPMPLDKYKEQASNGLAYRMDYSRIMFAKKWGCKDKMNCPQEEVHKKYVDVMPKKNTKWIDKNGNKQEALL
jgi:GT2 family glycosyltransferase